MRAFVHLRERIADQAQLLPRIDELESRYDAQFRAVFEAIRALVSDEIAPRRRIGFRKGTRAGRRP